MRSRSVKKEFTGDCPVMEKACRCCPFRKENGEYVAKELATRLEASCLTQANLICHNTLGNDNQMICRGSRNYQLEMYYRMGILEKATDEEWTKAVKKMQGVQSK